RAQQIVVGRPAEVGDGAFGRLTYSVPVGRCRPGQLGEPAERPVYEDYSLLAVDPYPLEPEAFELVQRLGERGAVVALLHGDVHERADHVDPLAQTVRVGPDELAYRPQPSRRLGGATGLCREQDTHRGQRRALGLGSAAQPGPPALVPGFGLAGVAAQGQLAAPRGGGGEVVADVEPAALF